MKRPCLDCGALSERSRCPAHEAQRERQRGSPTARGLDYQYQQVRKRVLKRDGYRCHWCGAPATTADHLIPRAHGGTSRDVDMVAACQTCNSRRGATVRQR